MDRRTTSYRGSDVAHEPPVARGSAALKEEEFRNLVRRVLGHDLRTPLSSISLSATLLSQRGGLDEQQARSVARIATAVESIKRILDEVLEVTRQG